MRTVRVKQRRHGFFTVHFVKDEEETVCRLSLDDLDIVEERDVEVLPALEGCGSCRRIVDGWQPFQLPEPVGEARVVLEPSLGRMRRTGSLAHGTRRHRGSRIR